MKEGKPMDQTFAILTEAGCDLPQERFVRADVRVAPMPVTINGRHYLHYHDERGLKFADFYRLLRSKAQTATSAPSPGDYEELAEEELKQGRDVLYLGFSAALSASFQAATVALDALSGKYPDRRIYRVDTLSGAMGQGLLVEVASRAREAGKRIEEAALLIERTKQKVVHYFTVADLQYLRRSGRLGTVSAALGTMLQLKPVLSINDRGTLHMVEKTRGYHRAISRLLSLAKEKAVDIANQIVYISHADVKELAANLADGIRALGPREVVVHLLGPVIASHTGPGAIGLSFLASQR
jgi:DegV family protein with EDD domain